MTNDHQPNPEINEPIDERALSEQATLRRQKLAALQAAGSDPYLHTSYAQTHLSQPIIDGFDALENQQVGVAGRMVSRRVMGKASFAHIHDAAGRIQIYVKKDDIGEEAYKAFLEMDIGDIIGVTGAVFKTRAGEISVHATEAVLLAKALLPLPEKFHGLKDPDLRFRNRSVDLVVTPGVREVFQKRSAIMAAIREFLTNEGFLEIETPVLYTLEIGAAARPFRTHLNALNLPMFLRIELELFLKRALIGGIDRVFEMGRDFRNEGMDATHNPEFTVCEFYQAYADYRDMMAIIERLYAFVAQKVCGTLKLTYQGEEIDLTPPWRRLTMAEAVKQYAGADYYAWADDAEARAVCAALEVPCKPTFTRGDCLAAIFEEKVEEHLIQPTIIMDYPVEISPLAKRIPGEPGMTQRFEFYIFRCEMGNAFSELNDPIDQRERFEKQLAQRRSEGIVAELDEDFLTAMEHGMPPTGGLGFGVDRMVMLMTDSASIRDVILFPTMKPRA